ncbi:MAG: O-acetyl-ADP-ribose deacetylase [Bacteroidetes bacterium]|nr:O-acetyl-ADP-ribose deacetylase [Bacteroidota bacterium]
MERIEIFKGDITTLKVDAIVNAANKTLLGGAGVDGAIHRVAGKELLAECHTLNGCNTGEAKITKAYNLPCKFVIHTVGPIWYGGKNFEEDLLTSCYKKSLELAVNNNIETIAFPNISTGVYGFPKNKAAVIAISEIKKFLCNNKSIKKIIFATFDEENFKIYQHNLA